MYRINKEIAEYLLKNANDPGFKSDSMNPFNPKILNTLGVIDPFGCFGSQFDYMIENDYPLHDGVIHHDPKVIGYWLYKRNELQETTELTEVPRHVVDSSIKDIEMQMDITDCCITLPDSIEKQMCQNPQTIERLLALEPDLKKCLKSK